MATIFIHGSADLYGSAKILLHIVAICVDEGEKVVVVLPHTGILVAKLEDLGANVYIINIGVLRRRYFTPWGMLGRVFLWSYSSIQIRKLIRKHRISKIYVNSANVVIGPFLKTITNLPLIWHLHEIVEKPSILRFVLTKLILHADLVIAVSSATRNFWLSQSNKLNINLLYNGIDCADYKDATVLSEIEFPFTLKKEKNAIIVGLIGRVQPWKGQNYFLEILKTFYQQNNSNSNLVYAVIVGDPYPGYEHYAVELKSDIEKKDLSQHVFYLGYRDDIPAILASIDILVVSSILPDPLPTVILEAMASAKPVISTKQGGAKEMILENETGFFIPLNNPQQSAEILQQVFARQDNFTQLGMNGYGRVMDFFSLSAFKRNWLNLFQSL
jgi:glycosyltransferase involved in cell wall biosynthesis